MCNTKIIVAPNTLKELWILLENLNWKYFKEWLWEILKGRNISFCSKAIVLCVWVSCNIAVKHLLKAYTFSHSKHFYSILLYIFIMFSKNNLHGNGMRIKFSKIAPNTKFLKMTKDYIHTSRQHTCINVYT